MYLHAICASHCNTTALTVVSATTGEYVYVVSTPRQLAATHTQRQDKRSSFTAAAAAAVVAAALLTNCYTL
jgi:hypothetical protein